MPSRAEIVLFDDSPPPPGASAWLPDAPRAAGHVGSTSVPGLPAKPTIDIDLTVADPGREQDYVPALESAGFRLVIREPWWYCHRMLKSDEPRCNLHVFGFDSPELVRHRIFRDWLRGNPDESDLYAAAKRQAAAESNAAGEHGMQYNARKEQLLREIYHRAFLATGGPGKLQFA